MYGAFDLPDSPNSVLVYLFFIFFSCSLGYSVGFVLCGFFGWVFLCFVAVAGFYVLVRLSILRQYSCMAEIRYKSISSYIRKLHSLIKKTNFVNIHLRLSLVFLTEHHFRKIKPSEKHKIKSYRTWQLSLTHSNFTSAKATGNICDSPSPKAVHDRAEW